MLFNAFFGKSKHPRDRHARQASQDPDIITSKTNLILNLILLGFLLIGLRSLHLSTIQYEEKLEESRKPQRKVIVEPARRGTIRDRFNNPLAINKISYQAAILYSPIRSIPASKWATSLGKKILTHPRKEYIAKLARLVGDELNLDPSRVEDLIYSKAALFFNLPYVIREEISEKEYYRLKMLEKDWPGIQALRISKREYPNKRVASDVIGYMGAISKEEYELVLREVKTLKEVLRQWEEHEEPALPEGFTSFYELEKRVRTLEELAYTVYDYVGKSGIEGLFEKELRGFRGKKSYAADSKGHFLKEFPGSKDPLSGKRVLLNISLDLQTFAEELLAQNEKIRTAKISGHGKIATNEKQPWIKGGAIVALDPQSGEILTLASWPRFDPNDFIHSGDSTANKEKSSRINRWFENETYLAGIWNMSQPLERELYDKREKKFYEDKLWLTWEAYLDLILPENHPLIHWFQTHGTVEQAVALQQAVDAEEQSGIEIKTILKDQPEKFAPLMPNIQSAYNKLLLIDLCQIAVDHRKFSKRLLNKVGKQPLGTYRDLSSQFLAFQEKVKEASKQIFHSQVFKTWRVKNEKAFLKEKRNLEKINKHYPKPYIDYLDEKENELFSEFWNRKGLYLSLLALTPITSTSLELQNFADLVKEGLEPGIRKKKLQTALENFSKEEALEYLSTFRTFQDLTRPLKGAYDRLVKGKSKPLEKHLASAFYPTYGFGYGRSQAFRQAATQGSIFKLVTAYEALLQKQQASKSELKTVAQLNPLNMEDKVFKIGSKTHVGYTQDGTAIPQIYKGGRIPRSRVNHLGHMDIIKAIETSSNVYFSLLASDVINEPEDLSRAAKKFALGSKTGIDLPGEISGKVPDDLSVNRNGLYAMAIGQHSLVVTPLQTTIMLAALANKGNILKPQIVHAIAGGIKEDNAGLIHPKTAYPFQEAYSLIGMDFPLFSSLAKETKKNLVTRTQPEVKKRIDLPESIRAILLEGLRKVVLYTQSKSLWSLSRLYSGYPEAISDYIDLKNQLIGKTSTSESMERIDLDEHEGTNLYTHVWFGGIAFEQDVTAKFENPELIVVVYLRFGSYGKEAAPIAAQIVKKWREIKAQKN